MLREKSLGLNTKEEISMHFTVIGKYRLIYDSTTVEVFELENNTYIRIGKFIRQEGVSVEDQAKEWIEIGE